MAHNTSQSLQLKNEGKEDIDCRLCRMQSKKERTLLKMNSDLMGAVSERKLAYVHKGVITSPLACEVRGYSSKVQQINDMMRATVTATPLQTKAPKRKYNHLLGKQQTDCEANNHYLRAWQRGVQPTPAGDLGEHCLRVLVEMQEKHDTDKERYSPIEHTNGVYSDMIQYAHGKLKATRDGRIRARPKNMWAAPASYGRGRDSLKVGNITMWFFSTKYIVLSLPIEENPKEQYTLWEDDWFAIRAAIPHVEALLANPINDETSVIVGLRLAKSRVDNLNNVHLTLENRALTGPPHYHTCHWAIATMIIPHSDWEAIVSNQAVFDNYFLPTPDPIVPS